MIELREFDDLTNEDLTSAWRSLETSGAVPNLFMSHPWVSTWARHFARDSRPAALVGYEGDAAVGLAPLLVLEGGEVRFPVNFLSHRGEFSVSEEHAAAFSAAVLGHLKELGLTPVLKGVPVGSLTHRHVTETAHETGLRGNETIARLSPYVDIAKSWDDYYAGRKRKVTHEWERKMRKLARAGDVEVRTVDEETDLEWLVAEFVRVEALSWKEETGTSISGRGVEEFYRDITHALAGEMWFRPFWLNLDGTMIGFIFGAVFGGTYFALKTSYDQAHTKLAPGVQLFREAVSDAFHLGLDRFDFVGQTARWKEEWATGTLEHVDLQYYPGGLSGLTKQLTDTKLKPLARRLRNR